MIPHLPRLAPLPDAEAQIVGGLNAARVGAVDTSVLRFSTTAFAVSPYIQPGNSADNGTTWTIRERGIYQCTLKLRAVPSGDVAFGISFDTDAAGLTADPFNTVVGMLSSGFMTTGAALERPLFLQATFAVTQAQAGGVLRCHATNGAGGAPAVLATAGTAARVRVRRISDLPE